MEQLYYTDERNAQIVIALLKAHNIKKVVASPGTTNICLISSMQRDPFFEIYSSPEERSAAYIACGLSAESGEPVVISCTGATASRNYMPALTEAFYRKLPILAITSSRKSCRIGHNFDQITDRTQLPKDVAKMSVQLPLVYDYESEWACVIAANKAILELHHHGNGPVHINLETNYSRVYDVKQLPEIRAIYRVNSVNSKPELDSDKIAIVVGAHLKWSKRLTDAVDSFCDTHNAVVLCDPTSNYKGKYRVFPNLIGGQKFYDSTILKVDLIIHIGDIISPAYKIAANRVWRVNPDGELRDPFGRLRYVFEMSEEEFFEAYSENSVCENTFIKECEKEKLILKELLPDVLDKIPFSNAWVASQTAGKLPDNSVLHLGILNSLRTWSYFDTSDNVLSYSNTGGFGIDGSISSAIGASLANKDQIVYCVLGDLAFFYDLNSLGNRHIGNNLRIILVNNGRGSEFTFSGNPGHLFGENTDTYIAAAGHYGNKSANLVKHYAEDLGFEYITASTKEEYLQKLDYFVSPQMYSKSIVFEIFTNSKDEDISLTMLSEIVHDKAKEAKKAVTGMMKGVLSERSIRTLKKVIKK